MKIILGLVLALAQCGQPSPLVLTPPADLLTCEDAPAVPASLPPQGTIERDNATLALWLAERGAGADCRSKVVGVGEWVKDPR